MDPVEVLRRRHARERNAREAAETLLEQKSAELFHKNEALRELNERLEQLVAERTAELVEARDTALRAARAKGTFLANMSHEIRTPLNGVQGMLELLAESDLSENQRDLADTAQQAAAGLLTIINNILDFSKIEADRVVLEHIDFDLRALIEHVLALFAGATQAKGLSLNYALPYVLPLALCGDPTRLQQVLTNLVANAIKFTERGGIELRVDAASVGDACVRLRFTVTDSGIGIAPEVLPGLFQPFTQADDSTTRKFGGTGLGLAISKRLVEMMGGELGATSQVGDGSRFHFTLTLPMGSERLPVIQPRDADADHPRMQGRVLLAEDNPFNSKLALRHLETLGLQVDTAADGRAAVALATTRHFDLVLMDCQMPTLDGFEATGAIRAHAQRAGRPRTPIIALTANAISGDRERCLNAGMDDYLSKPYRRAELLAVLQRWLPLAPSQASAPAIDPTPCPLPEATQAAGIAIWDARAALTRIDNDRRFLAELIALFLNHLPSQLHALDEALAARDLTAIERAAHSLAGAAANLSAGDAAEAARGLLALARAGNQAGADTSGATVKARFSRLREVLAGWHAQPDDASPLVEGMTP